MDIGNILISISISSITLIIQLQSTYPINTQTQHNMPPNTQITLTYPHRFEVQLTLPPSAPTSAVIEHMKKCGILPMIYAHIGAEEENKARIDNVVGLGQNIPDGEVRYEVYYYQWGDNHDCQEEIGKAENFTAYNEYYIILEGDVDNLRKYCRQKRQLSSDDVISNNENKKGQQQQIQGIKPIKINTNDNSIPIIENTSTVTMSVQQSTPNLKLSPPIIAKKQLPELKHKDSKNMHKQDKKQTKLQNKKQTELNPQLQQQQQVVQEGGKKIFKKIRLSKKNLKVASLRKIYSKNHHQQEQPTRNLNTIVQSKSIINQHQHQYQSEKLQIKFSLNNKIIETISVKKMQKVKSPILQHYDLFYDENMQKPIKNKDFIIAVNSRVLYCKPYPHTNQNQNQNQNSSPTVGHKQNFTRSRNLPIYKRIKQNQQTSQKQKQFQEFQEDGDGQEGTPNLSSKQGNNSSIFRIHKRKMLFTNASTILMNKQSSPSKNNHMEQQPPQQQSTNPQQQSKKHPKTLSKITLKTKIKSDIKLNRIKTDNQLPPVQPEHQQKYIQKQQDHKNQHATATDVNSKSKPKSKQPSSSKKLLDEYIDDYIIEEEFNQNSNFNSENGNDGRATGKVK